MTLSVKALNSYLGTRVEQQRGTQFDYAENNKIGGFGDYFFPTPENFFLNGRNPPAQHSRQLPKMIEAVIATAEHWVDIVVMKEATGTKDFEFLEAIYKGICAVKKNNTGKKVTIRYLIGSHILLANINTRWIRDRIHDRLKETPLPPNGVNPDVYVAQMRVGAGSGWNHAKIVAVDGKMILNGGHNLWSQDYLHSEPVLDLTMRYDGPIAQGGHQFANNIWKFVAKHNTHDGSSPTYSNSLKWVGSKYESGDDAPSTYWEKREPSTNPGDTPALWVTCPGFGVFADWRTPIEGTGMISIIWALQQPESKHCRISQQDIGSKWGHHDGFHVQAVEGLPYQLIAHNNYWFNLPLVDNLGDFLGRSKEHKLEMVLSSPDGGSRNYGHGVPPAVIFNVIGQRMAARHGLTKEEILRIFLDQVTLGTVALSDSVNTWANGTSICNHAKFWMVNDLFYIGSENLYPPVKSGFSWAANLQEFGIVADANPTIKKMILDQYFQPLLDNRKKVKIEAKDLTF